jgi:chromate transport protein ChrA
VKFLDAPPPGPDVVEAIRSLGHTIFYVYALRAAAVFIVVTSTLARRTNALPGWLSIAGFLIALVLLLGVSFVPIVSLLFPVWVATLSVVLLTRPRSESLG